MHRGQRRPLDLMGDHETLVGRSATLREHIGGSCTEQAPPFSLAFKNSSKIDASSFPGEVRYPIAPRRDCDSRFRSTDGAAGHRVMTHEPPATDVRASRKQDRRPFSFLGDVHDDSSLRSLLTAPGHDVQFMVFEPQTRVNRAMAMKPQPHLKPAQQIAGKPVAQYGEDLVCSPPGDGMRNKHRLSNTRSIAWQMDGTRAKHPIPGHIIPGVPTALCVVHPIRHDHPIAPDLYSLTAIRRRGPGLHPEECARVLVTDADFAHSKLIVWASKREKDRGTVLPPDSIKPLKRQIPELKIIHDMYMSRGYGNVYLPYALPSKYPHAGKERPRKYASPSIQQPQRPPTPRILKMPHPKVRLLQGCVITHGQDDHAKPASITPWIPTRPATHPMEAGDDTKT